jgi:hypothetical protein
MEKLSGNNVKNDNNNMGAQKNNLIENKQRKRRHSLPVKQFKISSLEESKIISIICDNIFEDVNIEQNNDPSMIDLSTSINLKNIADDIKNNKGDNINIINIENENNHMNNSKTFNSNIKNNNIMEDDDFDLTGPMVHKKSYIFNNILKLKMIKCPRLLEEQWKYEKILLDYNIIDFTSKQIKII